MMNTNHEDTIPMPTLKTGITGWGLETEKKVKHILMHNFDAVIRRDINEPTDEEFMVFDPTDEVLDEVWLVMSENPIFHYETINDSQKYAGLVKNLILTRTHVAGIELASYVEDRYRMAAFNLCDEFSSMCWAAYHDTRTDDNFDPWEK
jgi:hypothetical protein